jgi:hypothetical protein
MQIEPNIGPGPFDQTPAVIPRRGREATPSDSADFSEADALNQALRAEPEARAEMVAHARELIGAVNWPPREAIEQISNLLAVHLLAQTKSNESPQ